MTLQMLTMAWHVQLASNPPIVGFVDPSAEPDSIPFHLGSIEGVVAFPL